MANLKEIRTRISSVNSTRQITSAMKLVSASKLRKAQDIILQMRPYANKLHEILINLAGSLDSPDDNHYSRRSGINRVLIVLITSNRGLCGAFNSNAIRKALSLASVKYPELFKNNRVDFLTIGKKASDLLRFKKIDVTYDYHTILDKLDYEEIVTLADLLTAKFLSGEYDRIELVYNQFKNAAVQLLTTETFLPVELKKDNITRLKHDYIFEPSKENIVRELIPQSLRIQFYKALLDSNAAEHGARMTAMHKATDNATELLHDLRLNYNKARQSSITNEILEIVGGAEAQKK
ncbi:MAG: ATP synthase F1 subunit gamma [Bacteroidia bacterium]|nr:ATP synthase F1 subunit gamma [Bacteroidia bacterium]